MQRKSNEESELTRLANQFARWVALVFVAFLLFGAFFILVAPPMQEWMRASCPGNAPLVCASASFFLSYWGLLALPAITAVAYALHRILPRYGSAALARSSARTFWLYWFLLALVAAAVIAYAVHRMLPAP